MEITNTNFEQEVLQSKGFLILDFWATWCGPCEMIAPELEKLQQQRPDIRVARINVDEEMELTIRFQVESIPMLYLFKDGTPVDISVGYQPCDRLLAWVNKHE